MGSQPQAIPVDETIFSKSLSEFEMSIPYSSTPPPTPRDSRQPSPPHTHHHLQQHHHHQKQSHSQSDHQYSTRPHLDEWWKNLSELNEHQLRDRIVNYQVGAYAHALSGGDTDAYQLPLTPLTLLVYGPPGAGKSSLINTFSRVVHDETDYNPVAAVNDDERARAIRTYYTKNYPLGRGNLANGRIELWDCRGHWHVGAPQKDYALIRKFKLGLAGLGVTHAPDSQSRALRQFHAEDLVAVRGQSKGRYIHLIVFVLDPSSGESDQQHLRQVLQYMNRAEYPYAIVTTRGGQFGMWSNVDAATRIKLPGIPANDTWAIENYTVTNQTRNSDTDRQVLFVLCKLLLASEKSLLHRRRYHPFLLQAWESSDLLTYMCWVVIGMVVILSFLLL